MRAVISSKQISLSDRLAHEINLLARKFDIENYSKIEDIDALLLNRDISVEKKKKVLIGKLHALIAKTFAINRKKSGNAYKPLVKRVLNIRKLVLKLRTINNYLETVFLEDFSLLKINAQSGKKRAVSHGANFKDELKSLEYTAYRLIEKAAILDKRLLAKYKVREMEIIAKEKSDVNGIGRILEKETEALEHLEAKLPPPGHLSSALLNEPFFTQWAARVLALLSYIENMYSIEAAIFSQLKKNKAAKANINRGIVHLVAERSKLLDIMDEKAASMKKFGPDTETKRELRKLTAIMDL